MPKRTECTASTIRIGCPPMNDELITLGHEAEGRFEEKKSIFIAHACPVSSEDEAQTYIKKIKSKYADARHNVWGYRMAGDIAVRCSDDGEPQGSAGIPTLDVLRKCGVFNAVIVTTRYFGGILLGAGGLVRAYSAVAKSAVDSAGIVTYRKYDEFELVCSYGNYQRYLSELPKFDAVTDGTDFSDTVRIRFALPRQLSEAFQKRVVEISNGADFPKIIGQRFDKP